MVTQQSSQKDLSVLHVGSQRQAVVTELGNPAYTISYSSGTYDAYVFCQGTYSVGEKAARIAFHSTADLFTAGLWEIVGIPVEQAASGELIKVWVNYGADNKIVKLENLDLRDALPPGLSHDEAMPQDTEKPRRQWLPAQAFSCN
jgi:hypothetical protein